MLSIQDRAYLLMHLHAAKHHAFDCLGLLIGTERAGSVVVEDAIPLFHQRPMTGTTEIAFEMVTAAALKPGQDIVGLYEAALPTSLPQGKEISSVA